MRTDPPEKLNRARERRGNLPFYAHYTLTLDVDRAGPGAKGASTPTGRTVSTHLRRGHIRRLPAGNRWINSVLVNPLSPRKADKTYQIR